MLKFAGRLTIIQVTEYGRLGNNIQQILIAKLHIVKYGCKVSLSKSLKKSLSIAGGTKDFLQPQKALTTISKQQQRWRTHQLFRINADLFFYRNVKWWEIDTFINPSDFTESIASLAEPLRNELSRRNNLLIKEYERLDICVVHLRGGDISDLSNSQYVTNPLSYYRWLLGQSDKFLLVTEPRCHHPLFEEICELLKPESIVSHRKVKKDFYALTSSPKIATSGVGTFAIAAALLNKNLKKLFFSNAFCEEHLNPLLVQPNVQKIYYQIPNSFFEAWSKMAPQQRLDLLKNS